MTENVKGRIATIGTTTRLTLRSHRNSGRGIVPPPDPWYAYSGNAKPGYWVWKPLVAEVYHVAAPVLVIPTARTLSFKFRYRIPQLYFRTCSEVAPLLEDSNIAAVVNLVQPRQ
eukprot:1438873-Rhodomonas_salina.2